MHPIKVYDDNEEAPEGVALTTYAEDQPQYQPLPVARTEKGDVLSRWKLSPEEVKRVRLKGEVYLCLKTFNQKLQPVMLSVYRPDAKRTNGTVEFTYDVPNEEPLENVQGEDEAIWAESIYGARSRRGLVTIKFGKEDRTITPTEARAFAYNLLECADAAQTDEFLMGWLKDRIGMRNPLEAMEVLRDFRKKREEMRR